MSEWIELTLFLLTAFITAVIGVISTTYKLRGPRGLIPAGKLVITLTILAIILSVVQYRYTQSNAKIQASYRDSLLRTDYAKSVEDITANLKAQHDLSTESLRRRHDSSTLDIIKALAVYKLKYDSSEKKMRALVADSLRGTPDPVFDLDAERKIVLISSSESFHKFKVFLQSKDSSSKNFDINLSSCISNNMAGPYSYVGTIKALKSKSTIATFESQGLEINVPRVPNYSLVFFRIFGTYSSLKSANRIPLDIVVVYNIDSRQSYMVSGPTEEKVRAALPKN